METRNDLKRFAFFYESKKKKSELSALPRPPHSPLHLRALRPRCSCELLHSTCAARQTSETNLASEARVDKFRRSLLSFSLHQTKNVGGKRREKQHYTTAATRLTCEEASFFFSFFKT
jgi:hypothetical protein